MNQIKLSQSLLLLPLFSIMLLGVGCSSSMSNSSPAPVPANATQVSLTLRDAPPTGVTVISFKIQIVGAALQSSSGNVALLNGSEPLEVELTKLETESAFLGTSQVPAGTYTGMQVTLANPDLTVFNSSGMTIGPCANNSTCEFAPAVSGSLTYTGPPFPLTLNANSPSALQIDVNLNNIINSDFTLNLMNPSVLTVTQVSAPSGNGGSESDENEVTGVIKSVGANQFMLQDPLSGTTSTINVNGQTEYDGFDEVGCQPQAFSCLQPGQIVEVDQSVMPDGTLVAQSVDLKDQNSEGEAVEGSIVSLTGNPTTGFQMVVLDEVSDINGISVGNSVAVTIQPGAVFQEDPSDVPIPSDLSFASASDLAIGQEVHIQPNSISAGPPVTIATGSIRLTDSQITASVASVNGSTITLNNLPGQFIAAGITQIAVQTSSLTEFEDLSGVGALIPGEIVSVRGFLFNGTPPTLVAEKVRMHD
jgi:Domain of unknown function (DUF5666)/Domain of unknown function (DUF4382)